MKAKFLLVAAALFILSTTAFAQSVVVTSKKTVYKRPKASADFKRSFTVNYPKVKAATPAVSKRIESLLDYEKAFPGLSIKEQINVEEYLSDADYTVNYNKHNILDITLWYEGVAAYPSVFRKNLVINTKTGERVRPQDVFKNLPELAAMVRKVQLAEIAKTKEEYKRDAAENENFTGDEYFERANFTTVELNNFTISDEGVTFNYNYEFPHVVRALEPDGKYFFNWSQIKPFIKRGSLLVRFIA